MDRPKKPLWWVAAVVASAVAALVIPIAVRAEDIPAAYYSAVSAVIPLLLIALFTAYGRDRADLLELSRKVDTLADAPQGARLLPTYRRAVHKRQRQVRERFILATLIAATGETTALVGVASHSTGLLLTLTIFTMLGLVIVVVAAEVADLDRIPGPDEAEEGQQAHD